MAERGWIAVTHDTRIRYKPNELASVEAHGVALLVVIGHAPYAELARSFVATAPRIVEFVREHRPPFIAKVYRPSKTSSSAILTPWVESRCRIPGKDDSAHEKPFRDRLRAGARLIGVTRSLTGRRA